MTLPLQPHQERALIESRELAEKLGKLRVFLFGAAFNSIPEAEQTRLTKQYAYMRLYFEVLEERIAAF